MGRGILSGERGIPMDVHASPAALPTVVSFNAICSGCAHPQFPRGHDSSIRLPVIRYSKTLRPKKRGAQPASSGLLDYDARLSTRARLDIMLCGIAADPLQHRVRSYAEHPAQRIHRDPVALVQV